MEDRRCALSIKKVELCIVKTDAHQKMSPKNVKPANEPWSRSMHRLNSPAQGARAAHPPGQAAVLPRWGRPSHRGCCTRARHEKGIVNPTAAARGLCECRARARADVGGTACVMRPAAAGHSRHSTASAAPCCSRMPASRLRAPLLHATAWVAQVGPTASTARSRG